MTQKFTLKMLCLTYFRTVLY